MNDQMYKQNKKVMSSEYDNVSKSKQKNSRKERLYPELSRTCSTVTSERSYDENVFKTVTKRILHFLFSQVGVGSLVVGYTVCGAFILQAIEGNEASNDLIKEVEDKRNTTLVQLWNIANTYNTLNPRQFKRRSEECMMHYQRDVIQMIKEGYDESSVKDRWAFSNSLMFTLSVITTLGYGNTVPQTKYGKIVTMIYAVFGIPVYILYFRNIGQVFASVFKWLHRKFYYWVERRKSRKKESQENLESPFQYLYQDEKVLLPSTACVSFLVIYIVIGTIIFSASEGWNYLDSAYFCLTSLLKIGFGDFVPSSSKAGSLNMQLYVDYCYLLLGMGIVAMNYYLYYRNYYCNIFTPHIYRLKEEVGIKIRKLKNRLQRLSDKLRLNSY